MNKVFTTTIGIIAYNEANNIGVLLSSIARQHIPSFMNLTLIMVISDGSTDRTLQEIQKIKYPKLQTIIHTSRLGKNARLNELFQKCHTDLLVLLDGDIILNDKFTFENLLYPFTHQSQVGLICGNPTPIASPTLPGRASNNWIMSLVALRKHLRNGDNPYASCGPIMALSHSFLKLLHIPKDVPDDRYLYFMSKKLGFKFLYQESAKVWYQVAQDTRDLLLQGSRYQEQYKNLIMHMGKSKVENAFFIPLTDKIIMAVKQLTHDPIAYLYMKFIHLRIIQSKNPDIITWQQARTSKKILQHI